MLHIITDHIKHINDETTPDHIIQELNCVEELNLKIYFIPGTDNVATITISCCDKHDKPILSKRTNFHSKSPYLYRNGVYG